MPEHIRGIRTDTGDALIDYEYLANKPVSLKNPFSLIFTGASTGTYDGSQALTIDIPSHTPYTLPKATSTVLGGIKADAISTGYTVEVKINSDGKLYVPTYPTSTGGTSDYTSLSNKPQIGGIELSGDKTLAQLGIQPAGDYVTNASLTSMDFATNTVVSTKLNTNQGTSNTGKFMYVNSSGNIVPTVLPSFHTPRVTKSATDTTATLEPNTLYIFPQMSSLTINLASPTDTSIANEYHFFFISGAIPTVLTMNGVLCDTYTIAPNMKYEVSILEGVANIKGVQLGSSGSQSAVNLANTATVGELMNYMKG